MGLFVVGPRRAIGFKAWASVTLVVLFCRKVGNFSF